jgi:hypothetical protein
VSGRGGGSALVKEQFMSLGMIQDVKTAKVCVQGSRHAWDSGMSIYAGMRRIYKERSKRQARQAGRLMCDWRRVCDQMARDQYLHASQNEIPERWLREQERN